MRIRRFVGVTVLVAAAAGGAALLTSCAVIKDLASKGDGQESGSGSEAPADVAAKWEKIKKDDDSIWIADEWEKPVNLGSPVNTTGWEDSVSISPSGDALTFCYMRLDPIMWLFRGKKKRVAGPMRPGWPEEEPFNTHGAMIYVSRKADGKWQEPQLLGAPISLAKTADGDQWLSPDGNRVYWNSAEGIRKTGIYFCERKPGGPWQEARFLNQNINSGHGDENPYLSADEKLLYFQSKRPGGHGKTDLYVSQKTNGDWGPAKNLGSKINSKEDDVQPFISTDGKTFLFSRNEVVYRAKRQSDGSWGTPEVIVRGQVAEPTMTDAGDLCFLKVYVSADNQYDADILIARRKKR
jgi:hypothetical protein